jgi:hypothetical protein
MKRKLIKSIPRVCEYFDRNEFMNVITELNRYDKNVEKHYQQYMEAQRAWAKVTDYLTKVQDNLQ